MALHRSTGNSSSDSWSRCDPNQYSTLYDVRKRPDIKQESITATRPIHKDTIEITHDKLKEEALNRLRHTSKYVIAQNSFIRIGKYLFLAVALPPYFMIYGLPKWILVEGVPALFSFSLWMWKKIRTQTEEKIHSGTQKIIQMAQFIQRVTQVLLQPFVHLALQIRQSIRRFHDYSFRLIKTFILKGKQLISFPGISLTLNERVGAMRFFFLKIKEKGRKRKEEISLAVQQGIQWIKSSPQLILSWGKVHIRRLSQQTLAWVNLCKNRFETSQQWAQKATDWTSNQIENCFKILNKPFLWIGYVYKTYFQFRFQKINAILKRKWEKVERFLQQHQQRAFAFLQAKQEKLKRLSLEHFLSFIASQAWMRRLPIALQNTLKKCFFHFVTRRIVEAGLKCYSLFILTLLQVIKMSLHMLSYTQSILMRCYKGIHLIVQRGVHSIFALWAIIFLFIRKGGLYTLYYFLLCLTISLILLIWTFHSLGEYTSYLFSTFSFKMRKT